MNYLAIDTTGKNLKLLLVFGGQTFFMSESGENTHSETLFPGIENLFDKSGCSLDDLGCVGVVVGPGSFTGIRIGVAAVKGLCRPRKLPVAPVNTFMLQKSYNEYADEAAAYRACFDAEIAGGGLIPCEELYPLYLQNSYAETAFAFEVSPAAGDDMKAVEGLEKAYFCGPDPIDPSNPAQTCVTAKERGRVAGYYCAADAPGFWELLSLAVRREYRRCGVGGLLMRDLIGRAKAAGKEKVFLEVRTENKTAIRLYEKHGFKALSVRKGYYPDGADAVNMVLDLRD